MARQRVLSEITGNVIRGKALTDSEKEQINALHVAGMKHSQIAKELKLSYSTVQFAVEKMNAPIAADASKPRVGRPPVYTDRDKRSIMHAAKQQKTVKYRELASESNVQASRSTYYRMLKESGLKHRITKKRK